MVNLRLMNQKLKKNRYTILAPTVLPKGFVDAKVATQKICEAIQLDENDHKIGHTKVRYESEFPCCPYRQQQQTKFLKKCFLFCASSSIYMNPIQIRNSFISQSFFP